MVCNQPSDRGVVSVIHGRSVPQQKRVSQQKRVKTHAFVLSDTRLMGETPGTRIERIAAAKNLPSGEKLAHALGVTYETLRKWREGLTAPNRTKQQKIAEYLGVPPAEFMHGIAVAGEVQAPGALPAADVVLEQLGMLLAALPAPVVDAVAENLAGFARERGAEHRRLVLLTLLNAAPSKRRQQGAA